MLTSINTLKVRLGIEIFETSDDPFLLMLLKHVSARFAAECNRTFDHAADVTFEFRANETMVTPDRPPIESVSAFHLKTNETEGWVPQPDVEYLLAPQRCVIELAEPLGLYCELGRVTYSGGYVLPGVTAADGQTALPDDLEQACVEQAAYWYQRRTQLGLVSIASEGSIVQQFQTSDLLPQVRAVLKHYERWVN
jgi:hypothetical protein